MTIVKYWACFTFLSIGAPGSCAGVKPILTRCLSALTLVKPTAAFMTPMGLSMEEEKMSNTEETDSIKLLELHTYILIYDKKICFSSGYASWPHGS